MTVDNSLKIKIEGITNQIIPPLSWLFNAGFGSTLVTLLGTWFYTVNIASQTITRDQEKSIDERFLKTIELIGHDSTNVRSGGIIALKQVFRDSPNKQKESIELLANLIRINSPVTEKGKSVKAVQSDVAMALKVIKQTERKVKDEEAINLSHVNLLKVDLSKGKLENISFNHSNLQYVDLIGANLKGSYLKFAFLEGAVLEGANLEGSHLEGAKFNIEQIKKACNWRLAHYDPDLEEKLGITTKIKEDKVLDKSTKCEHFIPKQ